MNIIILFFIRKKLHLKKYQKFYFVNQSCNTDRYYFDEFGIVKLTRNGTKECSSHLSLNFILSNACNKLLIREE